MPRSFRSAISLLADLDSDRVSLKEKSALKAVVLCAVKDWDGAVVLSLKRLVQNLSQSLKHRILPFQRETLRESGTSRSPRMERMPISTASLR